MIKLGAKFILTVEILLRCHGFRGAFRFVEACWLTLPLTSRGIGEGDGVRPCRRVFGLRAENVAGLGLSPSRTRLMISGNARSDLQLIPFRTSGVGCESPEGTARMDLTELRAVRRCGVWRGLVERYRCHGKVSTVCGLVKIINSLVAE